MAIQGKEHGPGSVRFDIMNFLEFDPVTVTINQTSGTIQDSQPLPCQVKVIGLAAMYKSAAAGTCSINVVAGTAAEGGVGTKDTLAVSGTQMFSSDQAMTITNNTPQLFIPTVWDTIYPANLPLTLRIVSNGSGAGVLKVRLFLKPVDSQLQKGFLAVNGLPTY